MNLIVSVLALALLITASGCGKSGQTPPSANATNAQPNTESIQTTSKNLQTPTTNQEHTAEGSLKESSTSQGQALFLSNCATCHNGGGNPPKPNDDIMDSDRLETEGSFRSLLRQPTSPMMRTFSEQDLDNASVHSLYSYIKSLKAP